MVSELNREEIVEKIDYLHTQAVAKHKEGKAEEAIAFYLKSIEIDINQPAWVYGNAISLMAQCDRLDEGLELGEKALKIHPESDEIYRALGNIFDKNNNHIKCIENYQKALSLNQQQPEWLYLKITQKLLATNSFDEGISVGKVGIEKHPKCEFLYFTLGRAYEQKGSLVSALEYYEKATKINSSFQEAKHEIYRVKNKLQKITKSNSQTQEKLYEFLTLTSPENSSKKLINNLKPRSTPKDIEDCVDLNIAELRRNLMDSAIVNQFETLLEQVLINMENGLKTLNIEALVQTLAEIKTDIHYLKTKFLNPSPETVDPQAKKTIDLLQIIGSAKPTVIKCEMNQRIVGSGWHQAEDCGRWTGPSSVSSVVLPYPATGEYKFEMIVTNEALPGLLDSLKINIDNKSLNFAVIRNKKIFPVVIEGEFIANDRDKQSFLAIDLMIEQTICPQELNAADSRLIGLMVEKISLIPQQF